MTQKQVQEINMKVHLLGYGSASMALIRDHTYLLSGRLICLNLKTPPLLYYDQDLTFPMGLTESLLISLSNKTAVWGFGIVISKHEREDSALGQTNFNSLHVVMRHTDYDNQVSFNVSYKIPGNRNLAKTFGLFQPGREMLLSGTLTGYDKSQKMLQVKVCFTLNFKPLTLYTHTYICNQALSVSLSLGPDSSTGSMSSIDTLPSNPRKQYQSFTAPGLLHCFFLVHALGKPLNTKDFSHLLDPASI
ncbi:uncharacterized protein PGTG_04881 [Puccinia graminis f. sp. tritici CRL 75-36-700-3]|uniref:Uncharacterized protein n=1 Tax=Puccinia graminis f. sp. tritici (strain CRL 75-36-700-3 / race SCCL) TaxID=418459 RepID=E3K368_PUCGT|nr:uncharacterized protein PGTG_04881 [Puccinia graminis f. sp. tritici CRL 75-36-700-3]EFP78925.1 hypothetical protein PGTG_04881 [Puccinia graminis f. sp. tritici CRL 75-36-700-3]